MFNNVFIAFIVYAICIALALTSIGDYYLRFVNGMSKVIIWIMNYSGREEEYQADKYSNEIGYGKELIEALNKVDDGEVSTGVFNILESSHPETYKRIEKLYTSGN